MKAVILGGTGTLGREIAKRLLASDTYTQVLIVSRCELKQKQMDADFGRHPRLKFQLGDIRDRRAMDRAVAGAAVVFHVAALKHVDVLEENPEESVKTNVLGTVNVADAAEAAGVPYVVFSSTDKAVFPVNAYGMSKALSEKLLLARNRSTQLSPTRFAVFRWGNVLASRGSAVWGFIKALKEDGRAHVTHPEMTRFWIRIEDAVTFMLDHYPTASPDRAVIPPIRAASVISLIEAIRDVLGVPYRPPVIVGCRPGEKLHESLDEHMHSDAWEKYSHDELKQLILPFVEATA